MRYRIVANLTDGGRFDLLSDDEGLVRAWWARIKGLNLDSASLTQESREDDRKDVILDMIGAT